MLRHQVKILKPHWDCELQQQQEQHKLFNKHLKNQVKAKARAKAKTKTKGKARGRGKGTPTQQQGGKDDKEEEEEEENTGEGGEGNGSSMTPGLGVGDTLAVSLALSATILDMQFEEEDTNACAGAGTAATGGREGIAGAGSAYQEVQGARDRGVAESKGDEDRAGGEVWRSFAIYGRRHDNSPEDDMMSQLED